MEVVDRGRVVDHLGPGDTFGHISVLTGLAPALSVRALEDTPAACVCPTRGRCSTDAGRAPVLALRHDDQPGTADRRRGARPRAGLGAVADAAGGVGRAATRPIAEVAAPDHRRPATPAALVRDRRRSGAIVTDHDFRRRVGDRRGRSVTAPRRRAGRRSRRLRVSEEFSQAAAFSRMIDRGVHHLVVLDARGTPQGILRAVDFASAEIRNPLLVRSPDRRAPTTIAALRDAVQLAQAEHWSSSAAAAIPGSGRWAACWPSIVDALLRKLVALPRARRPRRAAVVDRARLDGATRAAAALRRRHRDGVERAARRRCAGGATSTGPRRVLIDMESCGLARCDNGANAVNPLFARSARRGRPPSARWLKDPTAPQASCCRRS